MEWWKELQPLLISAMGADSTDEAIEVLRRHAAPLRFDLEQRGDSLTIADFVGDTPTDDDLLRARAASRELGLREIRYVNTHCFLEATGDF